MIRPLVVGLMTLSCAWSVPAIAAAADPEQDWANLPVRMTAPAGALWQAPLQQVPPTRGPVLPSLYVSLMGLEAYDGYSTSRGLRHGAIESNTFMRRLAANPSALWAVKGGATFVSIYMAERLWRTNHRGQAVALMVVTNGLMAAVALNNASVLRAQK